MRSLRFIDLFAGLGGFHQALAAFGHECVFASEVDKTLSDLYEKNFGLRPYGDIRDWHHHVPAHDILCAGFPCQPFSKAGVQLGFDCPQWGDLFDYVLMTLKRHQPKYLVIENVPNILKHQGGATWQRIATRLNDVGYAVTTKIVSPHQFGVPQVRERAIIVGGRAGLTNFKWPDITHGRDDTDVRDILDKNPNDARRLSPKYIEYIESWQRILDSIQDESLPSFPIWAPEFSATYPFRVQTPASTPLYILRSFRGAFGKSMRTLSAEQLMLAIPAYARGNMRIFPNWKVQFIASNRAFFQRNERFIRPHIERIATFDLSFQKLEWNWKGGPRNLWNTILQFRASGIRAKRPWTAPSLVALTTSQTPVITWEKRYMTPRECARLQSMDGLTHLPPTLTATSSALGNAVNVEVIRRVVSCLMAMEEGPVEVPSDSSVEGLAA